MELYVKFVFFSFVLCFLINEVKSDTAGRDSCSSLSTVNSYSQSCIGALAAVNRTTHTDAEVCQMYNEVANCIHKHAISNGDTCDMENLHHTLIRMAKYTKWVTALHIELCNVTELSESICNSPDRLGMVTLDACGLPILGGFRTATQTGFICSTISGLDVCTQAQLTLLGYHCTTDNIRVGLQSNSAKQWLQTHLPTVSLDQCFTVYHPGQAGHDAECTDLAYISRHTTQAFGVLYFNNITVVGEEQWCRSYYYALHLMQHEMEKEGHACQISDLRQAISKYLSYTGVSDDTMASCKGQMAISTSQFCNDKLGVYKVMENEPYCKPYINHMSNSTNEAQACFFMKQFVTCSETKLQYAGFECSSSLFRDSSIENYLNSKYHINVSNC